jgi:hypothetical protein
MAAAPLGLALVRRDRLTLVNAELARLLGYTGHELRHLPLGVLLADAGELGPLGAASERPAAGQPYVGSTASCGARAGVLGPAACQPVRMDQLDAGVV